MVNIENLNNLFAPTAALGTLCLVLLLAAKLKKAKKQTSLKKILNGQWSIELILLLEWKLFEELSKHVLQSITKDHVETTGTGADGGIDLTVKDNNGNVIAIGQCKAYQGFVGVAPIRELYGVMASKHLTQGYFFTSSQYSKDAIEFANGKMQLFNGKAMLELIKKMETKKQKELYKKLTTGDFTTPTCPHCDIKMIKRINKEKKAFWGCKNFPKCKTTLEIRR